MVTIRIPRTKAGKTEEDDFDRSKVLETYGVEPKQLIEVKGLMGDTSDNIPGVPGVGEKTALNLIKEYKTIENLYIDAKISFIEAYLPVNEKIYTTENELTEYLLFGKNQSLQTYSRNCR